MNSKTENVGLGFEDSLLREAQSRAWLALDETAQKIRPGHNEKEAAAFLKESLAKHGVEKIWHPPQIRFGANTTKAFGEKGAAVTLSENDLFFLDIGPVFVGHEGDVGRTYTVGSNAEYARIANDAREVFEAVKKKWAEEALTGPLLYDYAKAQAELRGWVLSLSGASGHRVGDFPHAIHYRGKLKTQDYRPAANRWILEIHLIDPAGRFGAFYEDLL